MNPPTDLTAISNVSKHCVEDLEEKESTRLFIREPEDDHNEIPYQRVSVCGLHTTGVPHDELIRSANVLIEALQLRREYMDISQQSFNTTLDSYFTNERVTEKKSAINNMVLHLNEQEAENYLRSSISSQDIKLIGPQTDNFTISEHNINIHHEGSINSTESQDYLVDNEWATTLPQDRKYVYRWSHGLVRLYKNEFQANVDNPIPYEQITFAKFVEDLHFLERMDCDGPLRSFCFRRLSFLSAKYRMHVLLNELHELALQKAVPHRDFYNVRKVDTHIHAASSMNQKHLLRYIKKAVKQNPDEVVTLKNRTREPVTLKSMFEEMNITPYDLNVDKLDVHADRNTFHRFDKFNSKYNPVGEGALREVFLKTDNFLDGRHFANILKEVMVVLEDSKYTFIEPRISIYGKNKAEWTKLAQWAINHNVHSPFVRWLVQVPRLYDVYRINKLLKNFQEFLNNLFEPLFEVSIDPNSNIMLHNFLSQLIGFDSVDDESKPENPHLHPLMKTPDKWDHEENPPYSYYMYYMYANMVTLNQIRREQGLNTFVIRPHCGEAGPISHLSTAFLLSDNISHGLMLKKSPILQYLYYLAQVFIAMSPLSNNSLFVRYHRNPLPEYFARGLRVTLSTDDPLQFHFTREPLMEEYSIAAQAWKLSSCDMCELARNSVLMSGFSDYNKECWIGKNYHNEANDITKTNVPDCRIAYRQETLKGELDYIFESEKTRKYKARKKNVSSVLK